MEDIMPFASDYLFDMVPIVDDEDLKEWGQYSDENLVEKYRQNADRVKKSSPPLNHNASKVSPKLKDLYNKVKGKSILELDAPLLGD